MHEKVASTSRAGARTGRNADLAREEGDGGGGGRASGKGTNGPLKEGAGQRRGRREAAAAGCSASSRGEGRI
jgi:hypothetical protein